MDELKATLLRIMIGFAIGLIMSQMVNIRAQDKLIHKVNKLYEKQQEVYEQIEKVEVKIKSLKIVEVSED